MTFVLSKERNVESMKEALFAKRSIAYRATAGNNLYILPANKTVLLTIPGPETVFTVENCHTGNGEFRISIFSKILNTYAI